jgi:hypothetical protein
MWKRNKNNEPKVVESPFNEVFEKLTLQNQITEEEINQFIDLLPTSEEFKDESAELIFKKCLHSRSDALFHNTLKYLVQVDLDHEVDLLPIFQLPAPLFQNCLSEQELETLQNLDETDSVFKSEEDSEQIETLEKFKILESEFNDLYTNREAQLESFIQSLPLPFTPASEHTPADSISIHLNAFGLLDKKGKALLDLAKVRSMIWSPVYKFIFLVTGLGLTFNQDWFLALWSEYKSSPDSFSYLKVDSGAFILQILIALLFSYSLLKEIKNHSFTLEANRKKTALALKTLFSRCDVKQSNFKEFLTQKYSNLTGDELEAITLRVFR